MVRLSSSPLTLYTSEDGAAPRVIGHSVIGGARSSFYIRSVAEPSRSVGVELLPGAAPLLFGVSARELAERHTSLEDIWGGEARGLRERLAETAAPEAKCSVIEELLMTKLPRARGIHPVIVDAIGRFRDDERVASVVERSGYSHGRFIEVFREAVGLTPKAYSRVVRIGRAIHLLSRGHGVAAVAAETGYADQSHLTREMVDIAGLSPRELMKSCPDGSRHVPIATGSSRKNSSRRLPRVGAS